MSAINPLVRTLLVDVDNLLSEAERIQHEPFRNEVIGVAQKYLHTAASLLTAQKELAVAPRPETPPPSPIERMEETNTIVSSSTSRGNSTYNQFLAEIIPTIKKTFPSENPKMAMQRAAALWQRNKNKGTLEKTVKAARVEIRGAAPAPSVTSSTQPRTVVVEDALPSWSRFRSMSEENSMPGLEDAE